MFRYTATRPRVAYDLMGSGSDDVLVIAGWVSHLDADASTPEIRSFFQRLAAGRRVVRYDKVGAGLSDRPTEPEHYTVESQVQHCIGVLDAVRVEDCCVFAWSQGAPVALALAATHPERVTRMVLYGSYARMLAAPDYPLGVDQEVALALATLIGAEWGLGSRFLADLFIPDSDLERVSWFGSYQRLAASAETAALLGGAGFEADVRALLDDVRIPVLVLHRQDDAVVPVALGEWLADHLPQSRFEPLDGAHHMPFFDDSYDIVRRADLFLKETKPATATNELSPREIDVLRLVATGMSNREIADSLYISASTASRHVANILSKLGVSSRAGATAWAYRNGVV